MTYKFNTKKIDNINLTKKEWLIVEVLIKFNGQPINVRKIKEEVEKNNEWVKLSKTAIRVHIVNLNKKTGNLIKNKRGFGYYIEEIKIC